MSTEQSLTIGTDKASVLCEAIPFMRRFANKVVVVKYGGSALGEPGSKDETLTRFAEDVVLMRSVGMLPVVVHGGGPQIGSMMDRLGMVSQFVEGLRVTDAATLDIARMVLVGKINRDIVRAINTHGPLAVGLSGEDAAFIRVQERDPALGFVGDVVSVDPTILKRLLQEGLVPVVATIGADVSGQAFNINADSAAGALAEALEAEKFVLLTDVSGIRRDKDDPSTMLNEVTADELDELVATSVIKDGMIPKARACAQAVRNGVVSAHILDARIPHSLLLELLTEVGIGTMVVGS